jgi:hypothetical protein
MKKASDAVILSEAKNLGICESITSGILRRLRLLRMTFLISRLEAALTARK